MFYIKLYTLRMYSVHVRRTYLFTINIMIILLENVLLLLCVLKTKKTTKLSSLKIHIHRRKLIFIQYNNRNNLPIYYYNSIIELNKIHFFF